MTTRSLVGAALLGIFLQASLAVGADPPAADLYVSLQGNNGWSGTLSAPNPQGTDGPLSTLEGARDAIARRKQAGPLAAPLRVVIRGGTYRVSKPIVLTAADSGTQQAPITYAAWPGETPVLSGGVAISGWTKQGDGPLWTTTVPAVQSGDGYFRQLFVNGRRADPARFPQEGFYRSGGPGTPYTDANAAQNDTETKRSIRFQNEDLKPWANLDDAVVVIYHSWTTSRHRVRNLDVSNRLVEFTAPSGWPMGYWEKNQRYYVEFVREGLDTPGEWYLDRATGAVTYYPRPGEDMTTAEVVAPLAEELLRLEGDAAAGKFVEYVRFEGLSWQHTAWSMPDAEMVDGQAAADLKTAAIFARGARYCEFKQCEIARTGGYALWLQLGCKDNRLEQCHIHDLGAGGVRIGHMSLPDAADLQTERNEVDNCLIHDGGNVYHAGIGVWIGKSSHNTVHHNEICDFFYTGVSVGWSWGYAPSSANHNRIEYNHIHHLGWGQLSDMGGIYCLGLSPGTRLCFNRIHDVLSYSYGGWGLYTDEGSTGILMENNVVYRVKDGAFHQHYGRDNILRNNVLALSATYGQLRRSREEEHNSFTAEQNIIYSRGVPMLGGYWSNGHFKLDRNCYWDASGSEPKFPGDLPFAQWQAKGQDVHSVIADPKFVDPERLDFRLQPDSPALSLGFQLIDTGSIGLVGPQQWTELPAKIQRPQLLLPGE